MKTSLDFTAPADLSVGRVRIVNDKGIVKDWVATPDRLQIVGEPFEPGYYMAEVSPAGKRPQSVIFEVKAGEANKIAMPDFAALAATGGGAMFLNVPDEDEAAKSVFSFKPDGDLVDFEFEPHPDFAEKSGPLDEAPDFEEIRWEPSIEAEPEVRMLSVGIAIEREGGRESWDLFEGPSQVQLSGGNLSIEMAAPEGWTAASGRRARLSVAIQGVRVERLLLPLYRGGTLINVTPSTASSFDVALEALPVDPRLRALWRALEAGTREHAVAVRDHVLAAKGPLPVAALEAADPWEAMLAGLLFLRFPEIFGQLSASWSEALCRRHGWAADAHIIHARQIASTADESKSDSEIVCSAERVIGLLVAAQACRSPYFSFANMFFNELVESLCYVPGLPPRALERAEKARRRWQRELPLQRRAGASFSWLSRDRHLLKTEGILAPRRNSSGLLRSRDTSVLFKGRIVAGAIALDSQTGGAPKRMSGAEATPRFVPQPKGEGALTSAPPDCPALQQPPGPPDDSNKGRFGGAAQAGGFRLTAEFQESGKPDWVTIVMAVEAEASAPLEIGDAAWFCLHSTFDPQWVKVVFRGRRAALTVRVWGGFTVGVWLPAQQIELECNLAELESAPKIIRER